MNKTQTNSQDGQSLIIIALMIVGIFGFLGLVLDGGQVFLTRRNSQDAADAAAFAGVRIVATHSVTATQQNVYDAITTFARANKVITDTDVTAIFIDDTNHNAGSVLNATAAIPASATGVQVTVTIRLQPYFIDLLIGNQPIPIQSVAAAQSGPPTVGDLLTPMAIYCDPNNPCNYQYGVIVQLFGNTISNGGFQWLDYKQVVPGSIPPKNCGLDEYLWLTCSSGPVLADPPPIGQLYGSYYDPVNPLRWNTAPPYPNPWVAVNTGKQFAQITDVLDCWLDPINGTYLGPGGRTACWSAPGTGPRPTNTLWTVPVFDYTNGVTGNSAMYHTIMFAEFEFRGYWIAPNNCNWIGKGSGGDCANPPPDLAPCAKAPVPGQPGKSGLQCLMGAFQKQVKSFQIHPGACNNSGVNICAYGLSQ
jgi:hypothetical protein